MQLLDWRIPGTMAMFSLERNAPEDRTVFNIFFNLWEDNPLDSKGNQAENWINPTLHYFMYTLKELQLHLIASFVLG